MLLGGACGWGFFLLLFCLKKKSHSSLFTFDFPSLAQKRCSLTEKVCGVGQSLTSI